MWIRMENEQKICSKKSSMASKIAYHPIVWLWLYCLHRERENERKRNKFLFYYLFHILWMPLFLLLNLEPATLILYVYIIYMCMWPYFSLFLQHFIYLKSNWNIHTKKMVCAGWEEKKEQTYRWTRVSLLQILYFICDHTKSNKNCVFFLSACDDVMCFTAACESLGGAILFYRSQQIKEKNISHGKQKRASCFCYGSTAHRV